MINKAAWLPRKIRTFQDVNATAPRLSITEVDHGELWAVLDHAVHIYVCSIYVCVVSLRQRISSWIYGGVLRNAVLRKSMRPA